jgi:hypothetical protein
LAATRFQRADDPIVHRGASPLVLVGVDRQRRVEQRFLLLRSDSAIARRFLLGANRDPEAVERRVRQKRRILESSPVDRASKRTERAVDRGDFVPLAVGPP